MPGTCLRPWSAVPGTWLDIGISIKIYNHLRLLREFGTELGMPHARPLKGHRPLWELRSFPNRVIYFAYTGRRFIVLHVFKKKRQKTPIKEIRTAERRMEDWTRRQE